MLGIVKEAVAHDSPDGAALALSTPDAELEEFLKAHALTTQ